MLNNQLLYFSTVQPIVKIEDQKHIDLLSVEFYSCRTQFYAFQSTETTHGFASNWQYDKTKTKAMTSRECRPHTANKVRLRLSLFNNVRKHTEWMKQTPTHPTVEQIFYPSCSMHDSANTWYIFCFSIHYAMLWWTVNCTFVYVSLFAVTIHWQFHTNISRSLTPIAIIYGENWTHNTM